MQGKMTMNLTHSRRCHGIGRAPLLALITLVMVAFASSAHAARIKDVVAFEGIRDNILLGYGLVVGLNGTGDRLQNNAFTEQSLIGFLERQGVNTRGVQLKSKNVAIDRSIYRIVLGVRQHRTGRVGQLQEARGTHTGTRRTRGCRIG
jgi:hypothetical protein